MVGLTDSAVACLTTVRQAHSRSFLIISALFFLAAAASLALLPRKLSAVAAAALPPVHAFARAGWSVFTTVKTWNDGFHAFAALAIAVLSASCGGLLLWASTHNSREAMTVLAVYTCFVGLLLDVLLAPGECRPASGARHRCADVLTVSPVWCAPAGFSAGVCRQLRPACSPESGSFPPLGHCRAASGLAMRQLCPELRAGRLLGICCEQETPHEAHTPCRNAVGSPAQ